MKVENEVMLAFQRKNKGFKGLGSRGNSSHKLNVPLVVIKKQGTNTNTITRFQITRLEMFVLLSCQIQCRSCSKPTISDPITHMMDDFISYPNTLHCPPMPLKGANPSTGYQED